MNGTKKRMVGTTCVLLLLAAGCASNTEPVGSTGLELVHTGDYSRVHYLNSEASYAPLTAAELGDTASSTPVQVVFYQHFAVAWRAPNGVPRIGDSNAFVAAWRIFDPSKAQPTSGEVAPGDGPTVTEPTGAPTPIAPVTSHLGHLITVPTALPPATILSRNVLIDWSLRAAQTMDQLRQIHPAVSACSDPPHRVSVRTRAGRALPRGGPPGLFVVSDTLFPARPGPSRGHGFFLTRGSMAPIY